MKVDAQTTVLVLLAILWPVIALGGSDVVVEVAAKEGKAGWTVDVANFAGVRGCGLTCELGNFVAYTYRPVPAPKVISNALVESSGPDGTAVDTSGWVASGLRGAGIGRTLTGNIHEATWREFDGMAFPVWPVSLAAGLMLCGVLYRKYQARDVPGRTLCGVCSYDLRMHRAGERCPECGTVVGEVAADLA